MQGSSERRLSGGGRKGAALPSGGGGGGGSQAGKGPALQGKEVFRITKGDGGKTGHSVVN